VGERELTSKQVSVRKRRDGDKGSMALESFISQVSEEIMNRAK
jgi:threonyl-tRNA synthetase